MWSTSTWSTIKFIKNSKVYHRSIKYHIMSSKRLRTSTTFEQLMDGCIFALSGFQNPYRNEVHTSEFEIVLSSLLYLHYYNFLFWIYTRTLRRWAKHGHIN